MRSVVPSSRSNCRSTTVPRSCARVCAAAWSKASEHALPSTWLGLELGLGLGFVGARVAQHLCTRGHTHVRYNVVTVHGMKGCSLHHTGCSLHRTGLPPSP